jgi:Transposase DDE domain.
VLAWLLALLPRAACHQPTSKRLALLVSGLLAGDSATTSALAATVHQLHLTKAQEPSIHRRIARLEDDPQLDPAKILPALFRPLLPTLLKSALNAHAANAGTALVHHARFLAVRLVLDASSKGDNAFLLTLGLAYQGIVLPLAVRTWAQNEPLPEGEFMTQVGSLISEVQGILPPLLRPHVLFLADRGFGTPVLLDLLASVGWHWVLRVQDQVRIRLQNGDERTIRDFAPTPGKAWVEETELPPDPTTPIAAFKTGGWRPCQVVAAWQVGRDEPWLLVTNLTASPARLKDYALRWAIERLFLSWKSHGFDFEAVGISDPTRLGRLLTGLVIATLWRLAAAAPVADAQLIDLIHRTPRPRQLFLPLQEFAAPPSSPTPPWPAKFSLFTWGTKQFHEVDPRLGTPELRWALPDWDAPPWSQRCCEAYYQGVA